MWRENGRGLGSLRLLVCSECGRHDDGRLGWTMHLDVDDELQAFCPDCDEEEFGRA